MGSIKTIPTEITLYGVKVSIEIDDQWCEDNNVHGCFFPMENKIVLAKKYKRDNKWVAYQKQSIYATFIHELTHCLLYMSGSSSWDKENFVNNFSGLLNQVIDEIIKSNRAVSSRSRSTRTGSGRVQKDSKKNKDL